MQTHRSGTSPAIASHRAGQRAHGYQPPTACAGATNRWTPGKVCSPLSDRLLMRSVPGIHISQRSLRISRNVPDRAARYLCDDHAYAASGPRPVQRLLDRLDVPLDLALDIGEDYLDLPEAAQ